MLFHSVQHFLLLFDDLLMLFLLLFQFFQQFICLFFFSLQLGLFFFFSLQIRGRRIFLFFIILFHFWNIFDGFKLHFFGSMGFNRLNSSLIFIKLDQCRIGSHVWFFVDSSVHRNLDQGGTVHNYVVFQWQFNFVLTQHLSSAISHV